MNTYIYFNSFLSSHYPVTLKVVYCFSITYAIFMMSDHDAFHLRIINSKDKFYISIC